MGYRVKYGKYEVECDSVKDVKALIGAPDGAPTPAGRADLGASDRDGALLRQFMASAENGIEAKVVGGLLDGAVGRGVRFALNRWVVRVGLAANVENDVCEPARPGGKRGWRLSGVGLAAARALQGGAGE